MNLVDDVNKLYISALKPTAKQGIVRVSGLAEFAGWKVRLIVILPRFYVFYAIGYWCS
jgi:hypothetical protein